MKLGIRIPPSESLPDVVAIVRKAELAGLDHAWFPDSPLNYRDVWTVLGAVATHTDRIGLGVAVTNLSSRHPSVTASAACSIAESTGDRFILGIGAGDSSIGYNGLVHASTRALRDGVSDLRKWMEGSPKADESEVKLRHGGGVPPVYLAASGPANLALAGEIADGVITPMARLSEKVRTVRARAATAGRAEQVELVVNAMCLVTDDLERDVMLLAPFVVRTAQMEGLGVFEEAGIRLRVPDHVIGAAQDVGHPNDIRTAADDAASWVGHEAAMFYAQHLALAGTADDVVAGLQALGRSGVGRVNVASLPGLPWALVETLGAVKPRLVSDPQ